MDQYDVFVALVWVVLFVVSFVGFLLLFVGGLTGF